MPLLEKIQEDLKSALKERDEIRLSVLRMLKSEIKYREIDAGRALEEGEIVRVIRSLIKKREESIASFREGNRKDLMEREEKEIAVLKEYLPAEMGESEIEKVVDEVLVKLEEKNPRMFGTVMKEVMGILKDRADGRKVQEIVRRKLEV
jgi:uncharacterized protein YqeY